MLTINRRMFLMGLAASGLVGCASQPKTYASPRTYQGDGAPQASAAPAPSSPMPPRRKATNGPVLNPGDIGLDGIIDIHHHNTVSDFTQAGHMGGVKAVLHKASEGNDWFDPLYGDRRAKAQSAGLMWGAYHFGTRQHSGAEQAAAFLAAARPDPSTLLVLDLEMNERIPSNSMRLNQAEEFVSAIRASTGRLPVVYVQPTWADGSANGRSGQSLGGAIRANSVLASCDLWLADYRMEPELPNAWASRGWRFWQYAGDNSGGGGGPFGPLSRTVPGVERCDRSVFRGTEAELRRYWTGGSSTTLS